MRLKSFALVLGLVAVVGCGDDPDQSLNGVFPSSGFIGRKVRVEVSADNVAFEDGKVSLDFGSGVTVSAVTVSSPTALFADITIADTAPLGTHDVVVHNGNDTLTMKEAFKLESPVKVDFKGTLAQGSVVTFTATNLDLANLYDATCGASIFGICLLYTNMQVNTPAGVTAVVDTVEPFRVSGTLFVDVDAMAGDISFVSGPADVADQQVTSAMGTPTDFPARAPVALAAGTATTTTVMAAFDSHLYSFDAAATSVSRYSVSPSDPNATPGVYILPASGHFADAVAASSKPNVIVETAGKYFTVYTDASGSSGYSYAIRVNPQTLVAAAEADTAGANDTFAAAQNLATNSTILLTNASISDDLDEDWIKFTVPANSTTKKVHVVTAGDPMTDTFVEIWKGDPTVTANKLGVGTDSGYHEDVLTTSTVGAATTIWVHIQWSPDFIDTYSTAHSQYVAAIWLE
ncbi:MAG TPA: hypothetical protein VFV99_28985 [Kofleriaceae bacterium]|nr:hypothetical protein [Kofleriaceae bacterium]